MPGAYMITPVQAITSLMARGLCAGCCRLAPSAQRASRKRAAGPVRALPVLNDESVPMGRGARGPATR